MAISIDATDPFVSQAPPAMQAAVRVARLELFSSPHGIQVRGEQNAPAYAVFGSQGDDQIGSPGQHFLPRHLQAGTLRRTPAR